jgi:hypothetical protein
MLSVDLQEFRSWENRLFPDMNSQAVFEEEQIIDKDLIEKLRKVTAPPSSADASKKISTVTEEEYTEKVDLSKFWKKVAKREEELTKKKKEKETEKEDARKQEELEKTKKLEKEAEEEKQRLLKEKEELEARLTPKPMPVTVERSKTPPSFQSPAEPSNPQPVPPASSGATASSSKTYELILERGNSFRKESPFIRDLWKSAATTVSAMAGTMSSVQHAIFHFLEILNKAGSPEIQIWLCCVAADKLIGNLNFHSRALVWAFAYFARTVAEKFPDFIRVALVGAINKKSEAIISSKKSTSFSGEHSVKDFEIGVRFFVCCLCVCSDGSGLSRWISVTLAGSKKSFVTFLKIFVFLEIASQDMTRLLTIDERKQISSEINQALQEDAVSAPGGGDFNAATKKFYVDSVKNALKNPQIPDGIRLSGKETEIDPNR